MKGLFFKDQISLAKSLEKRLERVIGFISKIERDRKLFIDEQFLSLSTGDQTNLTKGEHTLGQVVPPAYKSDCPGFDYRTTALFIDLISLRFSIPCMCNV